MPSTENAGQTRRKYLQSDNGRSKHNASAKAYRARNREKVSEWKAGWYARNLAVAMLSSARVRARRDGREFSITTDDIVIPAVCPILGIPLVIGKGGRAPGSPSLDRIRSDLGYVPGNVQVISWRANFLKSDGTVGEFRKLLMAMEVPRYEKD